MPNNMMQNHLSRFEDHIQHLVEGGFARLFAGRLHPREVAVQLARAMEDHATDTDKGRQAPDIYIVRLHAQDHEAILKEQPELANALATELVEMARAADLTLANFPEVRLLADKNVQPRQVTVGARHAGGKANTTQALPFTRIEQPPDAPHAVLIMDGERLIPIKQPILNIGRHRDNHIILDNPRVSRHHAQIRLRFGRYVLFDLGSASGTTVNGHPIQEAILRSGDVITMADNTLIYVEDTADDDLEEGTRPYVPPEL